MYPTLYHAVFDLFGIELQVLKLVNTFGFLVMLAFFTAATLLSKELKRKGEEGRLPRYLPPPDAEVNAANSESVLSIATSALMLGFIGFKLGAIASGSVHLDGGYDAQKYLFSKEGSWQAGLVLGLGWAAYRGFSAYRTSKAPAKAPAEAAKPSEPSTVGPEVHTGAFTTAAAVGGLIGAKVFHWLETPASIGELFRHPSLGNLFSGLTVYGGLFGGAYACYRYARKHKLPFGEICDANAPGLMLAYCVGRLGCQLSGDGDWGIPNPDAIPSFLAFLPDWLWSFDYHNNVVRAGEAMLSGGFPGYGTHLVPPVYPTPLYESLMALLSFAILWTLRRRLSRRWVLFCMYLIMNGVSRFFVEKIRVNAVYDIGNFEFTQAELISVLLFLLGVGGLLLLRGAPQPRGPKPAAS